MLSWFNFPPNKNGQFARYFYYSLMIYVAQTIVTDKTFVNKRVNGCPKFNNKWMSQALKMLTESLWQINRYPRAVTNMPMHTLAIMPCSMNGIQQLERPKKKEVTHLTLDS